MGAGLGRNCSPGSYGDLRWWFSITTAAAGRDWAKGATGGHSGPQGPQMSANPWHPARLKSVRQNLSAAEAGTRHGTRSSAAGPATNRPGPLASRISEKGTDRDVDAGLNSAQISAPSLPPLPKLCKSPRHRHLSRNDSGMSWSNQQSGAAQLSLSPANRRCFRSSKLGNMTTAN